MAQPGRCVDGTGQRRLGKAKAAGSIPARGSKLMELVSTNKEEAEFSNGIRTQLVGQGFSCLMTDQKECFFSGSGECFSPTSISHLHSGQSPSSSSASFPQLLQRATLCSGMSDSLGLEPIRCATWDMQESATNLYYIDGESYESAND